MLSAQQLLAGADVTFDVEVPTELLGPGADSIGADGPSTVRLRPLRISDLQLVSRAADDQDELFATLMVQRALVEPELSIPQVAALSAGLVHFLLGHVNQASGLDRAAETVAAALEAPLAQAAFVLSKAYGWTPAEVNDLTLGQVLLHLELLHRQAQP